jgi:mono/diheme cytochrome c family protein
MSVQLTLRAGVLLFCLAMIGAARAETPLERGAYLVNTIMTCNNCHTPMGPGGPQMDKALSGGLTFDTPGFKVTAPNITPDKETGIGSWSDADLKKTLRTGVAPNGVLLAPVMPTDFYGAISERDMDAIVAYLHTVTPVQNQVPPPVYHRDFGHEVFPGSEQPIDDEGGTDQIKRGFYLATIGHCMECHTPMERGKHQWADRMGAGAQEFRGPWGVSVSRNITSDPVHGVGAWSDAELKRAITQGISRDGSKLNGPMGYRYYAQMKDEDLAAVIAWVRTLPPKS